MSNFTKLIFSFSFPMHQSNGLVRGYNAAFPYKATSPFLVRNSDNDGNTSGLTSVLTRKQLENQNSPTPVDSRNNNNNVNNNVNNNNTILSGGDFSSSQTLLHLVRASQGASTLENYLKGAVKRSADGEPNRLDPLDLTVGGTAVKRPRHELGTDRDLFAADIDPAAMVPGGEGSSRTLGGNKPSWMSLLDRRMHSSPTSSSRTSPKIQNNERSRCVSLCVEKPCSSQSEASDFAHWTVEDVVKFVASVDTCTEFAEVSRIFGLYFNIGNISVA